MKIKNFLISFFEIKLKTTIHSPLTTSSSQRKSLTTNHYPLSTIIIALLLLFSSCVTNKKYQYLQKNDVNPKRGELKKDEVLRTYEIDSFVYRLQPEDILSINFYSSTDETLDFLSQKTMNSAMGYAGNQGTLLLSGFLIDESGNVEFPVIGNVQVAGLTVFEAQDKIQVIAEQYLQTPLVEIKLLNFRFTILGEVNAEGTYVTYNNRISVLEALGLSGGLSELADKGNVKIFRHHGDTVSVYYLDLREEGLVNSPFFYVNQGDVIVVPPLKQRPFRMYWGENISIFTSTLSALSTILLVYTLIR
ncbi:MAG: polysaccharide biosynthesis/export family protein [Cyclobacteriaceae bacterium]|nr:polysaccharide biosynthesis/export family protein [Cyclobacteriaceae bacterium]